VVLRDRFSGTKEELARLRREAIDIRERLADENEGRGYWFANAPLYSYPVEVLPFSGDQDFALDSLSPFPAELTDKDLASNRPHEDQPDPSLCEGSKSPGPCEWEPLPGSPLLALQAFTQLRGHLSESLTCFIELLTWALRSLFVAPLPLSSTALEPSSVSAPSSEFTAWAVLRATSDGLADEPVLKSRKVVLQVR